MKVYTHTEKTDCSVHDTEAQRRQKLMDENPSEPDWATAPEWAQTFGFPDWTDEWCYFSGTHPSGVRGLVNRNGESLAYEPLPQD